MNQFNTVLVKTLVSLMTLRRASLDLPRSVSRDRNSIALAFSNVVPGKK
jgi:hypothetical protein